MDLRLEKVTFVVDVELRGEEALILLVNFYDMRSRNSSTRLEDPPVSLVTTM